MNIGEPWPDSDAAWTRVLGMQTKLHQWATDDPKRRFDDLYNLVYDPAILVMAWERVRGNRAAYARHAGWTGQRLQMRTAAHREAPGRANHHAKGKPRHAAWCIHAGRDAQPATASTSMPPRPTSTIIGQSRCDDRPNVDGPAHWHMIRPIIANAPHPFVR